MTRNIASPCSGKKLPWTKSVHP